MSRKKQGQTISFFTTGVITVISMTLVLVLLGLTSLVAITGKGLTDVIKENLGSITIEIAASTPDAAIAKMQKELETNEYIKSVIYISKDEIKKDLIKDLGVDPEEVLDFAPWLSYFDIHVKSEYVNIEGMENVKKSLKGKNIIQNIIYSDEKIAQANEKLSILGSILLGLTIILIAISFILIKNIIQLNIYSKRFLINTMQLVGATNSFIRGPFVSRMVFNGILAAFLAGIAITGIVYYVSQVFPEILGIIRNEELIIVYGVILVSGVVITLVATSTAVNKYLRMTTNKIYRA